MPYKQETIYTMECSRVEGLTAMIHFVPGEGWDVYYKKPGYPFVYAFGLPAVHTSAQAFDVAQLNADRFLDLFD